jgi:hypothetical protein
MIGRGKSVAALLAAQLIILGQIVSAQTHSKKAVPGVKPGIAVANYISHQIAKTGAGDNGIFYDTVKARMMPIDPVNTTGRQYQDIKITLEAGDVIKASVSSDILTPMTLTLFTNTDGHLLTAKTIIDTTSSYSFKLFYKATAPGVYALRVACKKRAPKAKDDKSYYYENSSSYNLEGIIATPSSGTIMDKPTVCDQLQFLLRQRLTNYMQITGTLSDTTMDVLDKKKIQSVNYLSTFTFYKNSVAKINVDPGSNYVAFDQSLLYNSDADAAQAQRYFVEQFKTCLGPEWTEEVETQDANWHKFKNPRGHAVSIIFYPGYKYVQILM